MNDTASRPSPIPWPPILLVGAIVAAWTLGRLAPIPWPGLDDVPARIIGYGFGGGGLLLIALAIIELKRRGAVVRPDAQAPVLVTSGPYAYGRNPIYAGDTMLLLGLAQLTLSVWFVAAAAGFWLLVRQLAVLPEERHLEARFGRTYLDYKARTRRWI